MTAMFMQAVGSSQVEPLYCDFAFVVGGERISLHRALLAARSTYFRRMLNTLWQPKVTVHRLHLLLLMSHAPDFHRVTR